MTLVHRHDDLRECTATTIVTGQSTVYANSKLISVEGDPDSHGAGDLVSVSSGTIKINGKKLIVITDHALIDNAPHTPPSTYPNTGSPNTFAY